MPQHTPAEAVQYWYDAATERREERDQMRAVVARIRQMVDAWEQRLPETIRTATAVDAIRTALEPAVSSAGRAPATNPTTDELRDQLLHAIDHAYTTGVLGYGTPEELLAAYDAAVLPEPAPTTNRADVLPAWEALYEPGNVSTYLIGYANDQDAAAGMAEAWMRSQAEVTGRLEWVDDKQMATGRYDRWFELIERHDDGVDTGPGIVVRRRLADEQPTVDRAAEVERLRELLREATAGASVADDLTAEWRIRAERAEAEVQRLRADRSAVLRWAADQYERLLADIGEDTAKDPRYWAGVQYVVVELRRLADEPDNTQTHADEDPARIDRLRPEFTEHASPAGAWQDEGRPRCPHCQMPHDLTPDSFPARTCAGVRQRIAEAARLHTEGEHRLCTPSDCDTAAGARQDEPDHVCNSVWARGEMDEVLGYLICGVCGKAQSRARQDGATP